MFNNPASQEFLPDVHKNKQACRKLVGSWDIPPLSSHQDLALATSLVGASHELIAEAKN